MLSSVFRTKREDLYLSKELVYEHFKKSIKNHGRGRLIKKYGYQIYKDTW